MNPKQTRKQIAAARLAEVRAIFDSQFPKPAETRAAAIDAWLFAATPAEVRNSWRGDWGAMPGWAVK